MSGGGASAWRDRLRQSSGHSIRALSTPQAQLHLPGLDSSNVFSPYHNFSLFRSCSGLRGCLLLAIKRGLSMAVLCSHLSDPINGSLSPPDALQPVSRVQFFRPNCFLEGRDPPLIQVSTSTLPTPTSGLWSLGTIKLLRQCESGVGKWPREVFPR